MHTTLVNCQLSEVIGLTLEVEQSPTAPFQTQTRSVPHHSEESKSVKCVLEINQKIIPNSPYCCLFDNIEVTRVKKTIQKFSPSKLMRAEGPLSIQSPATAPTLPVHFYRILLHLIWCVSAICSFTRKPHLRITLLCPKSSRERHFAVLPGLPLVLLDVLCT